MIKNSILQSYLAYKNEIDETIKKTLSGGIYILGPRVTEFEQSFAQYLGARNTIGVGNGTDAIQVALRAVGIKPGDEVITVSHTAVATVVAIILSGATPVLVDVDPQTYSMDPDQLRLALTKKTRAVLPVHLYGSPADVFSISDFCQDHDLFLIEDCAQSHGASRNGKKTGTFGHASAFSFYPTKNLGALGDGGAVVTNDCDLATRCQAIRQYGWKKRNNSSMQGINSRLDEIQAAILLVKLRYLDEENKRRQQIARIYDENLKNVRIPNQLENSSHVFHQYVIQVEKRDELQEYLASRGISTQIHYPIPIHLQDVYRGTIRTAGTLSCTERLCKKILSLPMHPWLSDDDVLAICDQINRFGSS